MPIRYQAMKNSVQTIAIAMKNGIISAITVPMAATLRSPPRCPTCRSW
jgi:hypothetical protein